MNHIDSLEEHERIDRKKILDKPNNYPYFIKFFWAKFHLIFICGRCSSGTRKLRDILNKGECWWWENWEKGNYDIPFWMGKDEHHRLKKISEEKMNKGEYYPHIGSLESAICHTISKLLKHQCSSVFELMLIFE
jgi:hypothetical protein